MTYKRYKAKVFITDENDKPVLDWNVDVDEVNATQTYHQASSQPADWPGVAIREVELRIKGCLKG